MKHDIENWDEFLAEEDDIEIVEVVGLEEDSPGASAVEEIDPSELVEVTFDEDEAPAEPPSSPEPASKAPAEPLRPATPEPRVGQPPGPPAVAAAPPSPEADKKLQERLVRLQADFENFQKRSERERVEVQRQANGRLIGELLPLLDNFERAIEAEGDEESLRSGVVLILRQLLDLMRREGLTPIEAEGQLFDPSEHEAVESDTPGQSTYRVVEVVQRGYRLNGRLLRPALVRVQAVPDEGTSEA